MRSDYALYVVAIICFIVAIYTATINLETTLYVYAIAVLGIVFVGLGYIARPKKPMLTTVTSPPSQKESSPEPETPPKTETKETSTKKRARRKKTTRGRKKKT